MVKHTSKKQDRLSFEELVKEAAKRDDVLAKAEAQKQHIRIATALRNMRKAKGLTQTEVAKKARWSQPYVARLESLDETTNPSFETIKRFAKACGQESALVFIDPSHQKPVIGERISFSSDEKTQKFVDSLQGGKRKSSHKLESKLVHQ